ncbi:peptidoglycan DD-metalloendopeptidase family protein [Novosphingobium sp.]|uniref:peptidoglycan DD-metalloendopeptidase family protein n=1 Tax=Novosphingobium sp. TaxID=1874826 RepID=UPI0025E53272|nr:peptidoglycan DD-metalloendopeptidase family protein [Novosphingobium sp.]MCC6926955.1 peptidoglycan DD-metalloendopeptidase family protein [Novosphingobium sp.]
MFVIVSAGIAQLASATPVYSAIPNPLYVQSTDSKTIGQGFLIKTGLGCQVLTPQHLLEDKLRMEVRGQSGQRAVSTEIYSDPAIDFAIMEIRPSVGDCDPIVDDVKQIDATVFSQGAFMLVRGPTGTVQRIELQPNHLDDREIEFRVANGVEIKQGMSGAPIVQDGRVVAMLVSVRGDRKDATLVALRTDYIARVAGTRLTMTADQQAEAENPMPVSGLTWPVDGPMVSDFRSRENIGYHDGIDIAASNGTDVHAAAAGKVIFAKEGVADFGGLVLINHPNGYTTAYGGVEQIGVSEGEIVDQGSVIARVAAPSTDGFSSGVHFEVRKDGLGAAVIDPLFLLGSRQLAQGKADAFSGYPLSYHAIATVVAAAAARTGAKNREYASPEYEQAALEQIDKVSGGELETFASKYIAEHPQEMGTSKFGFLAGAKLLKVDNLPQSASRVLLLNYQVNRGGSHAAETLIMLAAAMLKQGDRQRACVAKQEYENTFPGDTALDSPAPSQLDELEKANVCN